MNDGKTCLSCRAAKIKCDKVYTRKCARCTRLGLECICRERRKPSPRPPKALLELRRASEAKAADAREATCGPSKQARTDSAHLPFSSTGHFSHPPMLRRGSTVPPGASFRVDWGHIVAPHARATPTHYPSPAGPSHAFKPAALPPQLPSLPPSCSFRPIRSAAGSPSTAHTPNIGPLPAPPPTSYPAPSPHKDALPSSATFFDHLLCRFKDYRSRGLIATERARSLMRSWHITNLLAGRDVTRGCLRKLAQELNMNLDGCLQLQATEGPDRLTAFVAEAQEQAAGESAALCVVSRSRFRAVVCANERFEALYCDRVQARRAVVHHELAEELWSRMIQPESMADYVELFMHTAFLSHTPGVHARVLQVRNRYGGVRRSVVSMRLFCSACGYHSAICLTDRPSAPTPAIPRPLTLPPDAPKLLTLPTPMEDMMADVGSAWAKEVDAAARPARVAALAPVWRDGASLAQTL